MKLISMTDFVIEVTNNIQNDWLDSDRVEELKKISNYANFIKQPLKLEMFIPCDEDGNVLEEPKGWKNEDCNVIDCCNICKCEQYQQAKEKVLFEGIDLDTAKYHCERNVRTIEYFTSFNVELTPNAIKRIFG